VIQTQLTSDPEGTDFVDTTYDLLGLTATVSNPHRSGTSTTDGITTYSYDALGRVVAVIQPDGSQINTAYNSNCATVTDEAGKAGKSCRDGLGRLTQVFEDPGSSPHLNYETDYGYDALNNLLSVTQKGGASSTQWRNRTFSYDSLSRLLCAANPEIQNVTCPATGPFPAGAIVYTYDSDGNVLTKTAPSPNQPSNGSASVITSYTYDALNRLTGKSYQDSDTSNPATKKVEYGYDGNTLSGCPAQAPPGDADSYPLGQRTAMCDSSGATNWTHDKMGRILQERRTIGTASGKNDTDVYNLDGSVASMTSLGFQVTYTYSGAGRPLSATSANAIVQSNSASYAPFGGLTSAKLGAQPIIVTNTYNSRLQPSLLSASTSAATIMSLSYNFHLGSGDNGNVFQILNNRDGNRTQNFSYDSLNRIQQAYTNGPNWGETLTIDAWGNLTNRGSVSGKTLTEPFNESATVQNQLTGFNYDAAGNMISNGSATYTYNAENQLIATAGISYVYDGDGKRAKKCTEGTTAGTCSTNATGTLYWGLPGGDTLTETDLAGNTVENYIYFNGQRIARREPTTPQTIHFYFSDHLGTHSLITDFQGDMPPQEESDYFPYGGEIPISGSDPNHYKFTGKERDAESGLDMFGARYYANAMGRFTTPDWSDGPAGQHGQTSWVDTANRVIFTFQIVSAIPGTLPGSKADWGRNRLVKELHDRGYVLQGPTKTGDGLLYRNPATGEEMRIMPQPSWRAPYRGEPAAKFENDYYYRYRPGPGQPEGPHVSILDK
jgi:RHS repeat-associated protein